MQGILCLHSVTAFPRFNEAKEKSKARSSEERGRAFEFRKPWKRYTRHRSSPRVREGALLRVAVGLRRRHGLTVMFMHKNLILSCG